jgi:hypothetical protein
MKKLKSDKNEINSFRTNLSLLSLNTLKKIKDTIYVLENRTITSVEAIKN